MSVRLDTFDNSWYRPGRSLPVRALWLLVGRCFLQTSLPWPSAFKRGVLRLFGASVGAGVVIKPRVTVKYPWNLRVGDHAWIGEGAWIDDLGAVTIGSHACLSQGCMIETGNHDWTDPAFGLVVEPVAVEEGAWVGAKALLLPGARLASHAVLCAGGILGGETEPFGIYRGNPAALVGKRKLADSPDGSGKRRTP